jgi:hypothetical protein
VSRTELVTVDDQGAAEMVRSALLDAGIPVQAERAFPEHPYRPAVLAEPWTIWVPSDRLAEAQLILRRLEHDLADEVDAQALAPWSEPE